MEQPAPENKTAPQPAPRTTSAVRWYVCTGLLILLWASLLFYVQNQSFRPSFAHGEPVLKAICRGILDILFAASCVLLLPRFLVAFPIFLASVAGCGLIVYARYFGETMSVLSLFAEYNEEQTVSDAVIDLLPLGVFAFMSVGLAACLALLFFAGRAPVPYRSRLKAGLACVIVYVLSVFCISRHPELTFSTLVFSKETGDLVVVYGYLPVWIGECCVKNETALRTAALAQDQTDRLTPHEFRLPLPRQVVVLQIETLDYTIIDYERDGKIVTPFLNELKKRSFFYKVDTFHYHGSADADFAFLVAREPSRHILNYKIRTFPYTDTLPRAFEKNGYRTRSYHGVSGTYFNRISAYRKMGFSEIYFSDGLVARCGAEPRHIGGWNAVDDETLLDIFARQIRADTEAKGFFFAITLQSHTPFTLIKEHEIVPEPETAAQRYMNTIHVVDRLLGRLYQSLPAGTLVLIYGDHTSCIESEEYTSKRAGEMDHVPCFLSVVGESIAEKQKTADTPLALSGELTLVDISNYMRSLLPE